MGILDINYTTTPPMFLTHAHIAHIHTRIHIQYINMYVYTIYKIIFLRLPSTVQVWVNTIELSQHLKFLGEF